MPKSSTSDTSTSEEHQDPPRILDLGVKTPQKEQKEWVPPRSIVEKAYVKACNGVSLDKVGQLRRLIELVFLVDSPSRYLVSQCISDICGFNIAIGPGQGTSSQQSEETGTSSSSEDDDSSSSEDETEYTSSESTIQTDSTSTSSTSETSTSSSSETSTSSDPEEPEPEKPELVDLEDLATEPPPAATLFD